MAPKFALVTGAGSGVGRAAAIALAADGWAVALVGRRKDALEETVGMCGGARTLVLPTDVSDPAQVEAAFAALKAAFGRLDLLFNNAGTNVPGTPFEELTAAQWMQVVSVNLNGMFLCGHAAFRMMKDQSPQGGRIINNGSLAAYAPRPESVAYTATKHAVLGITRAAALDGRAHGIAVGQIDIGNAATAMTAHVEGGALQADGTMRPETRLDLTHIAATVREIASMPNDVNVLSVTILPTTMPFIGRG